MNTAAVRFADLIAAFMGIFDVDWDADFEDDGYTDLLGAAPVDEPFWIDDLDDRPQIRVVRTARPSAPASRRA